MEVSVSPSTDPMLLALSSGRHPAVVEMGIRGTILKDTIVDGGSRVNVLPEETWKRLGKPTLWPPTFNLVGADQHGIKPLGLLMAQQVTIGTQPFLLDFVVIPLKKKGYDAILGRAWLINARVNHNWKKNTLSMQKGGQKYTIDLHTQDVGEELASSDSDSEDSNKGEGGPDESKGKNAMEPNSEGVLELEGCSEDEVCSLNELFHWQMGDYEMFQSYRLEVEEPEQPTEVYLPEYKEYWKGDAPNPGDVDNPKSVGNNWNLVWKTAVFKIFIILLLLMYGKETMVPIEFVVPSLRMDIENRLATKGCKSKPYHAKRAGDPRGRTDTREPEGGPERMEGDLRGRASDSRGTGQKQGTFGREKPRRMKGDPRDRGPEPKTL